MLHDKIARGGKDYIVLQVLYSPYNLGPYPEKGAVLQLVA